MLSHKPENTVFNKAHCTKTIFQPKITNNLGTENNTMTVKVTDFEVFQALAMDSLSSEENKSGGKENGPRQHRI